MTHTFLDYLKEKHKDKLKHFIERQKQRNREVSVIGYGENGRSSFSVINEIVETDDYEEIYKNDPDSDDDYNMIVRTK